MIKNVLTTSVKKESVKAQIYPVKSRDGSQLIRVLDFGMNEPGLNPYQSHCVVFLCKTIYAHNASLNPGE